MFQEKNKKQEEKINLFHTRDPHENISGDTSAEATKIRREWGDIVKMREE